MEVLAAVVVVVQAIVGIGSLVFLISEVVVATGGALTPETVGVYVLFHKTTVLGLPLGWFLIVELVGWGVGYAIADMALGPSYDDEETYEKILWPLILPLALVGGFFEWLSKQRPARGGEPSAGFSSAVIVILSLFVVAILLARAFGLVK